MRSIYYFLVLFILTSCRTGEKEEIAFLDQKIGDEKKIRHLLWEYPELNGFTQEESDVLKKVYEARAFQPFWLKKRKYTAAGKILVEEVQQLLSYGLPQERYHTIHRNEKYPVMNELKITLTLLAMSQDLKYGFFIDSLKQMKPLSYSQSPKLLTRISAKKKQASIYHDLIAQGKDDTTYQKLALQLYQFTKNNPLADSCFKIPAYKKDSAACMGLTKKALVSKKYLPHTEIDSLTFSETLKRFQLDNGLKPDGKIGKYTLAALNETNLHKCQRAALALEKLRWKEYDYSRLITINIPEFTLRLYLEDTLKSVHRIIVGKEDKQTPELESAVYRIITYPYWSVPFSITSEEFLPILKRDPTYLNRNNMKLYRKNGEEIDSVIIDWKKVKEKTFPYKVVQQPGDDNSLGIIKFEFRNQYGVYLHDTPVKRLFTSDIRSFSHGCMRCEYPDSLAKVILRKEKNRIPADSLDSILFRGEHLIIPLKKRIPILVEYISVIVTAENKLIFLIDVYHRDEKYLKKMFVS